MFRGNTLAPEGSKLSGHWKKTLRETQENLEGNQKKMPKHLPSVIWIPQTGKLGKQPLRK